MATPTSEKDQVVSTASSTAPDPIDGGPSLEKKELVTSPTEDTPIDPLSSNSAESLNFYSTSKVEEDVTTPTPSEATVVDQTTHEPGDGREGPPDDYIPTRRLAT